MFNGLKQTYLVMRRGAGQLQTMAANGLGCSHFDSTPELAHISTSRVEVAEFDSESVYLLAWQATSIAATLTGLSDGLVVGSAVVEVGTDPTQIKVDWSAIDQLAISYTGTPGFPVTENFLFL